MEVLYNLDKQIFRNQTKNTNFGKTNLSKNYEHTGNYKWIVELIEDKKKGENNTVLKIDWE
jgi:hypothetical protein